MMTPEERAAYDALNLVIEHYKMQPWWCKNFKRAQKHARCACFILAVAGRDKVGNATYWGHLVVMQIWRVSKDRVKNILK